jgi:hypothetical protein
MISGYQTVRMNLEVQSHLKTSATKAEAITKLFGVIRSAIVMFLTPPKRP